MSHPILTFTPLHSPEILAFCIDTSASTVSPFVSLSLPQQLKSVSLYLGIQALQASYISAFPRCHWNGLFESGLGSNDNCFHLYNQSSLLSDFTFLYIKGNYYFYSSISKHYICVCLTETVPSNLTITHLFQSCQGTRCYYNIIIVLFLILCFSLFLRLQTGHIQSENEIVSN